MFALRGYLNLSRAHCPIGGNANKKGSRQIHLRMTLSEYDKIPDDPDIFDDDEEQQEEPDYYYCNCCGYSCVTDHGSWGCPRCTAIMEAQYY